MSYFLILYVKNEGPHFLKDITSAPFFAAGDCVYQFLPETDKEEKRLNSASSARFSEAPR